MAIINRSQKAAIAGPPSRSTNAHQISSVPPASAKKRNFFDRREAIQSEEKGVRTTRDLRESRLPGEYAVTYTRRKRGELLVSRGKRTILDSGPPGGETKDAMPRKQRFSCLCLKGGRERGGTGTQEDDQAPCGAGKERLIGGKVDLLFSTSCDCKGKKKKCFVPYRGKFRALLFWI